MQLNDWRLHSFFIDIIPVSYAFQTIEYIHKQKIENWNALSKTNAFGWAGLMSGFGSKDISWQDLLPAQETNNSKVHAGYNTPTDKTLMVIKRLLKQGRLTRKVQNALIATGAMKGF